VFPCAALHILPSAYGAEDLSQANTVYLDSHWGIGSSVRELVQGVDCPMTAAYMDAATFFKGSSKVNIHKNAVCVFEHNPGADGKGQRGVACAMSVARGMREP
jgi:Cu2+-containing amine oxidase